ncbi:hypothetical protein A5893_16165 [Pedobacter psychrophilus]|uniref:Secretion system C-terminal sorting domain-containing protein n=1 Tax=Pedobacter psychrophilus TaxID=1826909 RepID=A0A179DB96_9SPHI|nr:T9SS type A sorting domain-containing protein [Pedobacter psychrophilus]OAQ38321.1 hypothetical protein A5893_16165 [Pedobacter psychrophilus]
MKKILLFLTAIFMAGMAQAQSEGDYRTKTSVYPGTGNANYDYTWGKTVWWQIYIGGQWIDAITINPNTSVEYGSPQPSQASGTITLRPRIAEGGETINDTEFELNTGAAKSPIRPATNLILLSGFKLIMGVNKTGQGRAMEFNNIDLQGTSLIGGSTNSGDPSSAVNEVKINGNLTVASGATFNINGVASTGNTIFTTQAGYDSRPTGSNVNYGTVTLPLTLLAFDAKKSLNTVELSWKTTNEVNTNRAEVERAANSADFIKIGEVATNNISGVHFYSFTDVSPLAGNNYYRLKMIDNDGAFTYSPIKTLSADVSLMIYPNPVTTQLNISLSNIADMVNAKVYDATGKVVSSANVVNTAKFSINMQSLSNGTYVLKLDVDGAVSTRKFVK